MKELQILDKKTGELFFPERKTKEQIKQEVEVMSNEKLQEMYTVASYLRKFIADWENPIKGKIKDIAEKEMGDGWVFDFGEIPVTRVSKRRTRVLDEKKLEEEGNQDEKNAYKVLLKKFGKDKTTGGYLKIGK